MGFLHTEVSNVLPGPGETRVSKKGMEPLLLGTFVVNWICRSMELMCCRKCWLCSACWMPKVLSTYLTTGWVDWGSTDGLWIKLLHAQVGYNGTDWVTHGCTMDLFIILTFEEKIQAKLQLCSDVLNGEGGSAMELWVML